MGDAAALAAAHLRSIGRRPPTTRWPRQFAWSTPSTPSSLSRCGESVVCSAAASSAAVAFHTFILYFSRFPPPSTHHSWSTRAGDLGRFLLWLQEAPGRRRVGQQKHVRESPEGSDADRLLPVKFTDLAHPHHRPSATRTTSTSRQTLTSPRSSSSGRKRPSGSSAAGSAARCGARRAAALCTA